MPYSKAWRNAVYPDFRDEGAYVDYKATKDILHRMKLDIANPATPNELYESLLSQKARVFQWCTRKLEELNMVAEALFRASEHLTEEEDLPTNFSIAPSTLAKEGIRNLPPREARLLADSVLHELLRFTECRNLNTDTIEHIVGRMYRYSVLGPTGDKWKNVYAAHDFSSLSIDEVFYYLSTVYDRVHSTEERISTKGKAKIAAGDVGSQVFDRRSVKYWVHPQDLPFVIARILPHLPLSTFKDTYKDARERGVPFKLYSPVSSVYYDNKAFLFYHRRLERLEGSTLIRMRWYSDTYAEDWNAVKPDDNVFMEIKVHHEAWSGERSNKRRFSLKEREVDKYVNAELSLVPALEKLRAKKRSEEEQTAFKDLATEILAKMHVYNLKPVLRTQCGRAAFQRGADQTVRVSIDTDLRMYAEDFGLDHHWRYTGDDASVSFFPYAVIEIKLQCAENERIPPWIEELMGCRYMESVPKFSKYAHGIASLYGQTTHISMVPYWMHQMDVDIRASTKPEQSQWDPTVGLASGCLQRTTDRIIFGMNPAQTQTVGASEAQFLPRTDYAKVYQRVLAGILAERNRESSAQSCRSTPMLGGGSGGGSGRGLQKAGGAEENHSGNSSVAAVPSASRSQDATGSPPPVVLPPVVQYSVDRRHASYTAFHLYPYTETGAESLCFSPGGRLAAAVVFSGTIPWQTGKRIRVPQKYDPKTLLTSERYMVKWVSFATQFGLLGLLSIRFGQNLFLPKEVAGLSPIWSSVFHRVLGVLMECVALLTLMYAYYAFKARARRVYARRKMRYDDVVGPTVLTFLLTLFFVVLAALHVTRRYGPMLTGSDAF